MVFMKTSLILWILISSTCFLFGEDSKKQTGIFISALFKPISPVDAIHAPVVDGKDDSAWAGIPGYISSLKGDEILKMVIKTCKKDDTIFFLVKYKTEKLFRKHQYWHWDSERKIYAPGTEREESLQIILSNDATKKEFSDIWIWRAGRTNPSGYADDMFFCKGIYKMDKGQPCWFSKYFGDFAGKKLPRFYQQTPKGSAGDVKAKGNWIDGSLTIEFSRKLNTGKKDDIDLSENFYIKLICIKGKDRHDQ